MSGNGKKIYRQKFRKQWLQMEQFNKWLREVPEDNSKAYCSLCSSEIVAKYCALIRHTEMKKHVRSMHLKKNSISHIMERQSYGATYVKVREPSAAPAVCASSSVVATFKPKQKEKPSKTSSSSPSEKKVVVHGVDLSNELQQAVSSLKDKLASLSGQLYITEDYGQLSDCFTSIGTTLSLLEKIKLIS